MHNTPTYTTPSGETYVGPVAVLLQQVSDIHSNVVTNLEDMLGDFSVAQVSEEAVLAYHLQWVLDNAALLLPHVG